jgi:phosphate transport system permease protein
VIWILLTAVLVLCATAFVAGRRRALAVVGGDAQRLHSLPAYHGYFAALCTGAPPALIVLLGLAIATPLLQWAIARDLPEAVRALPPDVYELFLRDVQSTVASGEAAARSLNAVPPEAVMSAASRYASLTHQGALALAGCAMLAGTGGLGYAFRRIRPELRARNAVERAVTALLVACSALSILTTIGIIFSLLFESLRFFAVISPLEFLFGTQWSPQTALRADQVGSSGAFGAVPVFAGTLLITVIAMSVGVPVGLMSAIYLSDYAGSRTRAIVKPALEILAGIPTVVYGFFAALTVGPLLRDIGAAVGLSVTSESALAAGLIMGVMIIPFVSSLSDDVISAVPRSLREGALGLGATKSEMIRQIVLPAALPGIAGAVLLAVSRAIGETMIVVMAAGLQANLTANPFAAVTTVTVQIVTLLVGDQEFDSAKTLAAFALGLVLFVVTLGLNVFALQIVRKYREQYE